MSVLVTPAEMRSAEAAAAASGRGARDLMRAAGEAIAAWLAEHIPLADDQPRAVALAGPGNNGGDALAALAILAERGWRCAALLVDRGEFGDLPASPDALALVSRSRLEQLEEFNVILDGIYGIGGRADLSPTARNALGAAHRARAATGVPIVAVDLPSGVDAETGAACDDAARADATLCLGLPKLGLIREPAATHAGELYTLPIGIPEPRLPGRPRLMDAAVARALLPTRSATAHKNTVGSLLVIGGAPTYYGAPRMTGMAAARVGAALVTLAVPRPLVPVIAAAVPELTFVALPDNDGAAAADTIDRYVRERGARYTAAVVGPGLGRSDATVMLLSRILRRQGTAPVAAPGQPHRPSQRVRDLPLVLDADALNWLAEQPDWAATAPPARWVLTPHPGEMARLTGMRAAQIVSDAPSAAAEAARGWNQIVVLKSGFTTIAAPDGRTCLAPRATPELATAGTGDVLAGTIGGLLAQGLEPFDAARLGVYIGAMAGRGLLRDPGIGTVIATDLIEALPLSLRELRRERVNL